MRFKYADWIRNYTHEIVAVFGQAKLVCLLDGKTELRGGQEQARVTTKEWNALLRAHAVPGHP